MGFYEMKTTAEEAHSSLLSDTLKTSNLAHTEETRPQENLY